MSLTDKAACKQFMKTISPVALRLEKTGRYRTAAEDLGPLLTGRQDGNH